MIENAVVAWAKCTEPEGSCDKCACRERHTGMHLMICYPEKMMASCADFFKTRCRLHKMIYQHKTIDAVALMIKDVFLKADPYFLVPTASVAASINPDQEQQQCDSLPLSRIMCHPGAYLRVKDAVIEQIAMTNDPKLAEARKLVHRMHCRDLYKCVNSKTLRCHRNENHKKLWEMKETEITQGILNVRGKHDGGKEGGSSSDKIELTADDFVVEKSCINHGLKDKNPLIKMRFIEKNKLDKVKSPDYHDLPEAGSVDVDECELHLPPVLQACCLRVYCRNLAKCDLVEHTFSQFCEEFEAEMTTTAGLEHPAEPTMLSQEPSDDEDGNDDDGHYQFNRNRNMFLSPVANEQADDATSRSITPVRYRHD